MKEFIDGAAFRQMVLYAAAAIKQHMEEINDLNVFPVPDGDTGTNMSLTMGAAAAELKKYGEEPVGKTAERTANALLRGARGNSGVILSLLFRGMSKTMKKKETVNGVDLADALGAGVSTAYSAVMKPAEGTILTVSRLAAQRAVEAAEEQNEAEFVLQAAIDAGEDALAQTIHQNPVLQKAGVVDAGGKGYLIILRGMLSALRGEEMPLPAEANQQTMQPKEKADFNQFTQEEITFGYCTEFIAARADGRSAAPLREFLNHLGDSLVLVEDEEIIKVHVHTDHPGKVLEEALKYGALLTVKVENMREQHSEILEEAAQMPAREPGQEQENWQVAPAEKHFGFVAVCAGEGLASVFADLGCDRTINGGQTMNPATEDILKAVEQTPSEVVYVLPNNKNIIMAAEQCVSIAHKKVVVIPTRSVPQGVAAMLAMDPEADEEQNTREMTQAAEQVNTIQVTYAARDSSFDGVEISAQDYLALYNDALFGTSRDLNTLFAQLTERVTQENPQFITVYYGQQVSEEDAQAVADRFAAACPDAEVSVLNGGQPVYYYMISVE
ncbi:MAG: DAK2 domain-containing protein [Oscillospiraceae bacterium]|nr:DAK2 domain-containing protein [Oscillospiraceae bacterium]